VDEIQEEICTRLPTSTLFLEEECLKTSAELHEILDPLLGRDRVFGRMSGLQLGDYFDFSRLQQARIAVARAAPDGPVVVLGTGAWLIAPADATLLCADIVRWEVQLCRRRGQIGNFGLNNAADDPATEYKCGFFAEWRAADRLKTSLLSRIDFLLDTNQILEPKLISGDAFRAALDFTAQRPFRVVPDFDPGP